MKNIIIYPTTQDLKEVGGNMYEIAEGKIICGNCGCGCTGGGSSACNCG